MDFENMNIWCWLIPLLVGVICGILGYLIGKGSTTTIDNSGELNAWKDKNSKLQADLDAWIEEISAVYDKKTLLKLYRLATDEPFCFLYINLNSKDKINMFFKCLDKKLIPKE